MQKPCKRGEIMRVNFIQDTQTMQLDSIFIATVMFLSFAMARIFDTPVEDILLYLLVGSLMSIYKLATAKRRKRNELTATLSLGLFFSIVAAPALALKTQMHPLTVSVCLAGMVIAGEFGIYFAIERVTGYKMQIDKTED